MLAEKLRQTFGISTAAAVIMSAKSAYAEPPPEFRATGDEATSTVTEMDNTPVQTNITYTFEIANDAPPPLKPLEICAEAEKNTSQAARDIATSDEKFTNVRSWSSNPEAADILRYRLCQEEELVSEDGDSILRDAMRRLEHTNWLPDVLLPFFETNPGFFYENRRLVRLNNEQWTAEENRFLNQEGFQRIRYTEDVLLEAIKNPRTARHFIETEYAFVQSPDSNNTDIALKIAEIHPVLTLSYGRTFARIPGYTAPDNIEELFLSAALKPQNAGAFLRNYNDYSDLPEAREIIKRAINADPVSYYKNISLSREISDDETLKPSAESLKQAAKRTVDILYYYEHFAHLPEAMDIVRIAARENTVDALKFFSQRRSRDPHVLLERIDEIFTSTEDLFRAAVEKPSTVVYSYPIYKHLPEARDILKTVANQNPAEYFSNLHYMLGSSITESDIVIPDTDALLSAATSIETSLSRENHTGDLIWGYQFYKDIPEARDIVKTIIEASPSNYFHLLRYERMPDDLKGKEFFPSVSALGEAAANGHLNFSDYKYYKHLPEAKGILQPLIDQDPLTFFRHLPYGEGVFETADYSELRPSPGAVKAWAQRMTLIPENERRRINHDVSRVLHYYPYYKDEDDADEIMRLIIDDSPKNAIFALNYYRQSHRHRGEISAQRKEFFAEQDKGFGLVFKYLVENHRDFVTPGKNNYIKIDGLVNAVIGVDNPDPELVAIALDLIKEDPLHVLFFLAKPYNKDQISKLKPEHQQSLLSIAEKSITSFGTGRMRDSLDLFRYILSEEESWLAEPGRLSEELFIEIITSSIEIAPTSTIKLLSEKIDLLKIDTENLREVIEGAVFKSPLIFLDHITKNEKQADLVIGRVRIPYSEILQKSQESLIKKDESEDEQHFYRGAITNTLNNLHNYGTEERFALVKDQSPAFFAKLATGDDSSYYTSTFNYIINRVIDGLETDPEFKDELLQKKTGRFLSLIVNAAHFGRIGDVLSTMNPSEVYTLAEAMINNSIGVRDITTTYNDDAFLMHRYRNNGRDIISATVVEILSHMAATGQDNQVEPLLKKAFLAAKKDQHQNMMGAIAALYIHASASIEGFDPETLTTPFFKTISQHYLSSLANYLQTDMQAADLFDDKNRHLQRMVFYNDEDGHNTFGHFKSMYRSDGRWKYKDHGKFISFHRGGIYVFANKPEHETDGQKAIDDHVEKMGGTITSLIHRGHSYHVSKTSSAFLNEDTKFYWLGSCRSSSVWRYLDQAPKMQFIYSENIGAMRINDSILLKINNELAAGRDVNWLSIQENALSISGGDKRVKSYVFPDGSYQYALRLSLSTFDADKGLTRAAYQAITQALENEARAANVMRYPQQPIAVFAPSPY